MSYKIEIEMMRLIGKPLIIRILIAVFFDSCLLARMQGKCVPLKANKKSL
jgi:hypothetical protein